MAKFDYVKADTVEDAVRLLNEPGIRSIPLAGGTDIYVALRVNPVWFDRLVDISRIPEMTMIQADGNRISIGASVTFAKAAGSQILRDKAPFLVEACESIGGPAVRNCGTFGGNVANAAVCADSLPSLVCLEANAHLVSPNGERQIKVEQLVKAPHETGIEKGELLTHFSFDIPLKSARSCFIKIGRRKAQSISRLSIAVLGSLDAENIIDFVRICPGAAVSSPTRFQNVEKALIGNQPGEALFASAADQLVAEMIASTGRRWSTPYKEVALKAIAERSLKKIFLEDGSAHVN